MNRSQNNRLGRWALVSIVWASLFLGQPGATFAQTTKWKFIAVGDTRGPDSSHPVNNTIVSELALQIVSHGAEFVVVPGDLVYSGSLANFQTWRNLMAPVYQAGIGVYPLLGNHDANDVNAYVQVFGGDLPDNGPAGEVNRTYAFSCDNVLVLALDNFVNPGRVNQAWIDEILQANTLPHVFVMGHMPAFKANHTDCLDDYPTQRNAFWNSLKNAGGRTYFCGHDHFYDHMRVDDGDGNSGNDLHQLIVGMGGAPFHTSYAYDGNNAPWTPVGVAHEAQYGYTVVEVDGPTITMTFYHRTGPNTYAATSDVWTYTVSAGPTPPAPPTGLAATPGDAQVALRWNAAAGATSYSVKRATDSPSGPYTTIATGVAATSFTDSGLANGTTYYYVVTAVNEAGESSPSAYAGATPMGPLAPPTNLVAVPGRKAGQIRLSWTAAPGATSYRVKRAPTTGGPYTVVKSGLRSTAYTDSRLPSGTTYYYVVSAVNATGESPNSTEANARTN